MSWLASALVQLAGRALPCRTAETVAPMVCAEHQSSTPRRISTAHGLSSPLKMRSISPARRPRRRPGRWYLRSPSRRSTRALVSGATSGRPLTTLDTVGSDTPASAAMAARVGRCLRFPRTAGPVSAGSLADTFVTAPHHAAPGALPLAGTGCTAWRRYGGAGRLRPFQYPENYRPERRRPSQIPQAFRSGTPQQGHGGTLGAWLPHGARRFAAGITRCLHRGRRPG